MAEITLSPLRKNEGYKDLALVEGIEGHLQEDQLSENTEDNHEILLRILSITINHYFSDSPPRSGNLCLVDD